MPTGRPHITVPKFTDYEIILAELCAANLWKGLDYQSEKKIECSDEEFLHRFAVPVRKVMRGANTQQVFTEDDIRTLIRLAKLKALFRSKQPTNFQAGISSFSSIISPIYFNAYTDNDLTEATLEWSKTFVSNPSPIVVNGNYRVPLASRILFFTLPEFPFFNFSNQLTKKMNLPVRPQAALKSFNKYLHDGMNLNKCELANLTMPDPIYLSKDLWNDIMKSGWWQRRVLDLALLLKFNIVTAYPSLKSDAKNILAERLSK